MSAYVLVLAIHIRAVDEKSLELCGRAELCNAVDGCVAHSRLVGIGALLQESH